MPNHFHLLLQEKTETSISTFMQKVMTGYTMYFNRKYGRTGALFGGTFKSKHVHDDRYFKYLAAYIHLNPAELGDPAWKSGNSIVPRVKKFLESYSYSSLPDHLGVKRPENILLGKLDVLYDRMQTMDEIITNAQQYYIQNEEV